MGPAAFAKLATDPRGVKLLTAGFKLKPGASGMVPIVARMVKILNGIDKEELKATEKARRKPSSPPPTLEQLRGQGGRGF
jgi:hypothetical protein